MKITSFKDNLQNTILIDLHTEDVNEFMQLLRLANNSKHNDVTIRTFLSEGTGYCQISFKKRCTNYRKPNSISNR